jgi:hypothetical protein
VETLSSAFHHRLLRLLSGRAIIAGVEPFADPVRRPRRPSSSPGPRRHRRPGAPLLDLAAAELIGLSLLVAACGGSPRNHVAQLGSNTTTTRSSPSATTSAGSAQQNAALAFSRCMRSHGVSNFPDPDSRGNFPSLSQQALGVPKQTSLGADEACKRLLPHGGAGTGGDQQKLAFALKVAQCMRRHGFPTYPDPTTASPSGQGSGTRFEGTGIDTKSPRFQTTETTCEKQARKALGLP